MTRGPRHLALVLVALVAMFAPAVALGASPAPSFAPVSPPSIFQAWLDSDFVVPDAPPGGVLQAGFTFWNSRTRDFGEVGEVYARMRPASGDAPPTEATVESDFPGHYLASFVVPEGGPGDVGVGMRVDACTEAGCGAADAPFAIAGVGPPPDADPATLVTATFLPFVGDTVAGRTFPVGVHLQPRGLWDFASIELPDGLEVVASRPGQPAVASAPLLLGAEPGTPWTGRLTIPDIGPVELSVQVPSAIGVGRPIAGEPAQLDVIEGGRRETSGPVATAPPAPSAPAAASDERGIPLPVLLGAVALALVGGAFVLRRVLADL